MLTEHPAGWGIWKGSRFHTLSGKIHYFPINDKESLCTHFSLEERYVKTTKFLSKEDLLSIYHICKNCDSKVESYERWGCRPNDITTLVENKDNDKISKLRFRNKNIVQILEENKKVLVAAGCAAPNCDEKGFAYEDPNAWKHKPHYCIKHNPLIKGAIAA